MILSMIIFEAGSTVVNFLKFPRFTSGQNERQITEQISCILIIKEKLRIFARARSARHRRDGKKNWGGGHIFARRILKLPDESKMNQNIV